MSTGMTKLGSLQSRGVARLARAPFPDLLASIREVGSRSYTDLRRVLARTTSGSVAGLIPLASALACGPQRADLAPNLLLGSIDQR
jgi:hypothetical protein